MVHEDNPEVMWSHSVRGTISKIRTKANHVGLIRDGARSVTELNKVEDDLWLIAKELDEHVRELFIEIGRLRKKCDDDQKVYRCYKCSHKITKEAWDGQRMCKSCLDPNGAKR